MADPADKYALLDSLPMAPGQDWITRSDAHGPFIDTGCDVQFAQTGRIYLSVETIREMAQVAGLFDRLQPVDPDREGALLSQGYREGVNARGAFDLAVEQLAGLADRLHGRTGGEADEAFDDEPAVLVTDGPDQPRSREGADKPPARASRPRGEGNGTRRNRRPAGVPAGASDGDAFRI